MQPTVRRRLLVVLASLTLALLVADLAHLAVADGVRRTGGLVLGPVQRALAGAPRDDVAALESENVRLRAVAAEQQHRLEEPRSARRASSALTPRPVARSCRRASSPPTSARSADGA